MGLFRKKAQRPYVAAIVLTEQSDFEIQQPRIDETPLVLHSISLLEDCPLVDEIVLVCREQQIAEYYSLVQEYRFGKVAGVVGGGMRRPPVFEGIAACGEQAGFYVIHDGARPLVTRDEIEACIAAAFEYGAAAVGAPIRDVARACGEDGFLRPASGREQFYAVQTPRVFAAGIYREAMQRAAELQRAYTDDCQLVEQCGYKVFLLPGSCGNQKITTPEDLAVAQTVLDCREQGVEQWLAYE